MFYFEYQGQPWKIWCQIWCWIFIGYSTHSKAYRIYNKRTNVVEESIHVAFDETNPTTSKSVDDDDVGLGDELQKLDIGESSNTSSQIPKEDPPKEEVNESQGINSNLPREWKLNSAHPIDQILGDPSRGATTRNSLRDLCNFNAFISQIEPKNFKEAEFDESWLLATEEEINQFVRHDVWELVPRSLHQSVIWTKLSIEIR